MRYQSGKDCKYKIDCARKGIYCKERCWNYVEKENSNGHIKRIHNNVQKSNRNSR